MSTRSNILIVDDDTGMIRAVERVLGRSHEITTAASPLEGLALAETITPDLAVLDIRMPGMNGFELRERLVEIHPEIDVIFMTGSVTDTDAHLIRAIREGAFYFIQKPFDREVLRTLVDRCLELRRLREEKHHHMAHLQRELEGARLFQQSLLPPQEARLEGLNITARYRACAELGGDLYDYVEVEPGRVAVLIADVSGHGAQAAMMTSFVKSAFHAARDEAYAPQAVLQRVTKGIWSFEPDRFVTLLCARFDAQQGSLEYVNAGHPPAIAWGDSEGPTLLEPTGPLISSGFQDLPWESASVALAPDNRLLLYTDGLVEARSAGGTLFGADRIVEAATASPNRGAGLLDDVLDAVAAFTEHRPYEDDLTLLSAEVGAA